MNRLRLIAAVSAMTLALFAGPKPSAAQLIVFDPNNYAQNVLTAARALQQINNQIVSLQNQAQMPINQAKNLASLPYSSLAQLEASIQRTQQLLTQAQRIAYSVTTIDQAFTQTYPQAYSSSTSSRQLVADAQKYGARVALFGRKIKAAEDPLLFITFLREIVNGSISPEEAVRAYHGGLQTRKIPPVRSITEDLETADATLNY